MRTADAGDPETYATDPAADLVLLCGIFGNVSDADVEHTVAAVRALCAPGARVVWTRTRRPPDLTPRVREWFADNGFREVAFEPVPDSAAAVGVAELEAAPSSALGPERLFTFVPTSSNARTLEVYEQHADRYRATLGPGPAWHVAFLDRVAASLPPGASVLELGSGTGANAQVLADRGLAVQPSDAASSFVEAMRERVSLRCGSTRSPTTSAVRGTPSSPSPCCSTSPARSWPSSSIASAAQSAPEASW